MEKINLSLTVNEINTILQGLGSMPYAEVHQVIETIHNQASKQLQGDNPATKDNTEKA